MQRVWTINTRFDRYTSGIRRGEMYHEDAIISNSTQALTAAAANIDEEHTTACSAVSVCRADRTYVPNWWFCVYGKTRLYVWIYLGHRQSLPGVWAVGLYKLSIHPQFGYN